MRRDEGSTLPLVVLYGALGLVLIFLAVAATSLYLERKRLFTLADGAALVGAEAFALDAVVATPAGFRPTLRTEDVAAAVTTYLAGIPDPGFEALTVEHAGTDDERGATVILSAVWRPPVLPMLAPDGIRIEVTSRARSVFG